MRDVRAAPAAAARPGRLGRRLIGGLLGPQRVRGATGTSNGLALLEVANTGPVVPPYEVEGLFEPFHRLGTDRLAGPGAGLGLSIVRAAARAHGGEVHAVPREEGGLIVTVSLPAAQLWN